VIWNAVERIVKVIAYVNATLEFTAFPTVANGESDLYVHSGGSGDSITRGVIGGPSGNACVETEVTVEVRS
jgi:hypothetical protein